MGSKNSKLNSRQDETRTENCSSQRNGVTNLARRLRTLFRHAQRVQTGDECYGVTREGGSGSKLQPYVRPVGRERVVRSNEEWEATLREMLEIPEDEDEMLEDNVGFVRTFEDSWWEQSVIIIQTQWTMKEAFIIYDHESKKLIKCLSKLEKELNEKEGTTNSRIVGASSASLIGGAMSSIGLGLSPFTMGGSLALVAVGSFTSIIANIGSARESIDKYLTNKRIEKEAKQQLGSYSESLRGLEKCFMLAQALKDIQHPQVTRAASSKLEAVSVVTRPTSAAGRLVLLGVDIADGVSAVKFSLGVLNVNDAVVVGTKTGTGLVRNASRGFITVGSKAFYATVALNSLGMAVDLGTMFYYGRKKYKGSKNDFADDLGQKVETVREQRKLMMQLWNDNQNGFSGRNSIAR